MSWGRGTRGGILEGVDLLEEGDPLEEVKEWDAISCAVCVLWDGVC